MTKLSSETWVYVTYIMRRAYWRCSPVSREPLPPPECLLTQRSSVVHLSSLEEKIAWRRRPTTATTVVSQ